MPAGIAAQRLALAAAIVACLAAQLVFSTRSLLAASYTHRGEAVQLAGDQEGARQLFHRANQALPFDADRFRLEAAAARESLGPEAAAPLYARGLELAPRSPLVLLAAAENLVTLDQTDNADELLRRADAVTPDDWKAHELRGLILLKRERPAEAAGEFRAAASFAYPFQPEVSYNLARVLHATGDDPAALLEVEKSIRAQALSPEYHLLRGKILFAKKEIPAARKDFAWAVQTYQRRLDRGAGPQPLLPESQELLAQAFAAEGRPNDARSQYTALLARPGLPPAMRDRAQAALAALPPQ